ncbi:hypothetical protein BsWGS_10831 [Bradybaena similaris]
MFDHDSNGKITTVEIMKTFSELSLPINDEQAQSLVDEFDKNGDGELEFTEFISMVKKYLKVKDYPVEGMFKYFDVDGDGYITDEEFVNSLKSLGIDVSVDVARIMMAEFSTFGTVKMNYPDFLTMMRAYF